MLDTVSINAQRYSLRKLKANWKIMLVLGTLGIGAFNTLLDTGLQTTTALNAMLL